MNTISLTFYIIEIVIVIFGVGADHLDESDIVEKLYWTPKNETRNIRWEFSIIGKRVAWNVGRMLCSSRNYPRGPFNGDLFDDTLLRETSKTTRNSSRNPGISGLAVLDKTNMTLWLARMISESNYQYDGLWIGGHRKKAENNWTWIAREGNDELLVPSSSICSNYPKWYKTDKVLDDSLKNCLIFERTGHDVPLLVPTDCRMQKPFVCSRIVTKELPPTIVKGTSVIVDGSRYTIFTVDEGEEMSMGKKSGFRRLNSGGVKWFEARLECRKRGQYLAMVLSNEAAKKIASIMLKNRPSVESVWLGGWSSDGTEWRWSTTGLVLPSTHSPSSHYPPWLNGHPNANYEIDEVDQIHGRCLVLDRHFCPQHINPVFLDLDCKKNRPFVCQDGIPTRRSGQRVIEKITSNKFSVDGHNFEFSGHRMTWNQGRVYCSKNNGKIASILDSKTLSTILERMADLYLDHVWVGGRTLKTRESWKWYDETGNPLKSRGIGMQSSWCLGNDESLLLRAEPNSCLNLDREGYGSPLFYGLSCNLTRQHVLCSFDKVSRSTDLFYRRNADKNHTLEDLRRRNIGSRSISFSGESENENIGLNRISSNHTFDNTVNGRNKLNATILSTTFGKNAFSNLTKGFRIVRQSASGFNVTNNDFTKNNEIVRNTTIANLDENTKKLLAASGYNISDSDSVLSLELELVDLQDNFTVKRINGTQRF